MTNKIKTLLNDEILHFLYSNQAFQGLSEEEQQQFLNRFQTNETFKEMIEISMDLDEVITEVEATMPKIQDRDYVFQQQEQKQVLKSRTVVSGNVYYVPFDEVENIYSPIIIAVQQSESMKEFETFCKGIILPLFNLSALQKRDIILLPFCGNVSNPINFKNGLLKGDLLETFMNENFGGEAKIVPPLDQALELFYQDTICNQRDLMIITDNQFTDFDEMLTAEFSESLAELDVEVSVIAMSEVDFEVQPIPFADKVFFANE